MNELFCSHDTLRMASQSGPPTCVSFDSCHEMIYVGWTNGEISTYRASCSNNNLINWSAFPAHHRTAVLQTFGNCGIGLYSLSSETFKIHSSGGMELFCKPRNIPVGTNQRSTQLTCMAAYSPEKMLFGTRNAGLMECDVNSAAATLTTLRFCESATRIKVAPYNPRVAFVGTADGTVSMLDNRMGKTTMRTGSEFKATGGGRVSEMDINSSSLMVCAGYSSKNVLEPYVRVFDIRMNNRQLNPIHFASPVGVQFLQDGSYSNVLCSSATGTLRIVDASTSANLHFASVASGGGKVQHMSTSYTGLAFAMVDTDSFIHFWETCPQYRHACMDRFLESSHPTNNVRTSRWYDTIEDWDSQEICGLYASTDLSPQSQLLSSSFPTKFLHAPIKPSPKATLKIKPEILQKRTFRGSTVGVLPANEVPTTAPGLSLLFGKHTSDVYVNVDPRRQQQPRNRFAPSALSAIKPTTTNPATTHKLPSGELDYSQINQTQFAGLGPIDFAPQVSRFTSAVLQLLYFIPEFHNLCSEQDPSYLPPAAKNFTLTTIPAELNMVFRMLNTARELPSKAKCCQARNFIVALLLSDDAVALNLQNMASHPVVSTASLVHFIFAQFIKLGAKQSIGSLFSTQFLQQQQQGDGGIVTHSLVVDLVDKQATLESTIAASLTRNGKRSFMGSQLAPYLVLNCADWKPQAAHDGALFFYPKFGVDNQNIVNIRDSNATGATEYELIAVVSLVGAGTNAARTVSHVRVGAQYKQMDDVTLGRKIAPQTWLLFDQASVVESTVQEALEFSSRVPLLLVFARQQQQPGVELVQAKPISIEVFATPPISQKRQRTYVPPTIHVKLGDVVAMDCEFVAITNDLVDVNPDGSKIVTTPRQLALARVSVVDSNFNILIDDLVAPMQPVVDHLTRFSGLVAGDLDPAKSTHPLHLFPFRTVYAKLLYLVEHGCVFVGHGLDSDFKVVNILLPPKQIRDTVHLFWLRNKRKLGLRFLSNVLLQESIQDRGTRGHDSVQDACAALRLYFKYQDLQASGKLQETLARVYMEGPVRNWS